MAKRRSVLSAVLAAALLLGQWLSAAHEPDHALQPGAAHGCAVCVYAQGAGAGLLPSIHLAQLDALPVAPEGPVAIRLRATAQRHHPIRGPPTILA